MGIPNRQIGWDQQSNLLWQLQAQLNKLGKTMSQCCGSSTANCISFTDITWEAFIAAVDAGTIADCYYNIIDRPNSGTDPLYVLVEKGLPNFDNEVRREEQASSALCITTDRGVGCFNVYAESETISFDYIEGATVYPVRLRDCSIFAEGDVVTFTSDEAPFPTYVGVIHYGVNDGECTVFFQITGGTGVIPPSPVNPEGTFSNGVDDTDGGITSNGKCIPLPTLSVGDVITGYITPEGGFATATITSIIGATVTIAPTSGDWTGISVFYVGANKECFFVTTAPITTVSILLTPDPICFDFDNLLGYGVRLNTLMQATDGLIYGTLQSHNQYDGQLFSMDPVTEQVKILFAFDDNVTYGYSPSSGLVEIAGELYGTCNAGGSASNPGGTIWKWNIATNTFTVLHSIDSNSDEGVNPYGTLLYTGGKLYGTCSNGGSENSGTLFEFDPIGVTYTVLVQMNSNESIIYPQGPLVEVIPGELWGTSTNGGTNDSGTVFKYTLSTGIDEIVFFLDDISVSGEYIGASGGVMLASDGNVYFNTNNGGVDDNGTICQITDISTIPVLSIVHSFDIDYGYGDAVCPVEIAGNLYGCTNDSYEGGTGCSFPVGSIYKYDLSVGIFTTLHTFNVQTDGGSPYLGQLLPLGDVLYGMTNYVRLPGGCPQDQYGQIFKYNITTDVYTNIQALNSPVSSPADVATSICESIVDPGYTCTTVGGCIFVSGTQFGNEVGQTLVIRTIVTFEGDLSGCFSPTIGQLLYNDDTGDLIGTVFSFTGSAPFTMQVELDDNANPGYTSLPFNAYIDGDGCVFIVDGETGTIIDYTVQPFAGGKEPVNRPCYYNATYDVITDYPLSQPHTKAEIDYLVTNNLLVPGAFYHIMDVDLFLYGGTEIVIQANSHHSFNDTAMGLFYNPRYDQDVSGYGIYDNITAYAQGDTAIWGGLVITFADGSGMGNTSAYNLEYNIWTFPGKFKVFVDDASVFTAGEIVYDPIHPDYSILITEVGVDYIIVSCPPLFLGLVTQLDNGVDTTNITSIELHESFYSDLIYNAVWDEITYDYAHDFISSRKDNVGNAVEQSWSSYELYYNNPIYRAIAGFQWGNEYANNIPVEDYVGMFANKITDSYVEVINFRGRYFIQNVFDSSSFVANNLNGRIIFQSNVFINNCEMRNCNFVEATNCSFTNNYFNFSLLHTSEFDGGSFYNNTLNNSIVNQAIFNSIDFINNALKSSELNLSTQVGSIERVNFDYVILNDDISLATRIYENTYSKDVVQGRGLDNYIKYVSNAGTYAVVLVTT